MPDVKLDADQLAAPRYLDVKSLDSPSIALSNALLETVRMSEVLNRMFETALSALAHEEHGNPQAAQGAG